MNRCTRDSNTPEDKAERIAKLRSLSDDELQREGRAARFLARPGATRAIWAEMLEECRAEWRRRHPAAPATS